MFFFLSENKDFIVYNNTLFEPGYQYFNDDSILLSLQKHYQLNFVRLIVKTL